MSLCPRGLRPTTCSASEVWCGVHHWASACRTLAHPARQLRVPNRIRHRDQHTPTGVKSGVGVSFISRPPALRDRLPSLLHPNPPVTAARDRDTAQAQGDPRRAGPVRPPERRGGRPLCLWTGCGERGPHIGPHPVTQHPPCGSWGG